MFHLRLLPFLLLLSSVYAYICISELSHTHYFNSLNYNNIEYVIILLWRYHNWCLFLSFFLNDFMFMHFWFCVKEAHTITWISWVAIIEKYESNAHAFISPKIACNQYLKMICGNSTLENRFQSKPHSTNGEVQPLLCPIFTIDDAVRSESCFFLSLVC